MPLPTRAQLHIDTALTNISLGYSQAAENFVADKVFPLVPVSKQSNKYFTYNRGDFFRGEAQRRAPGTPSAGAGWRQSTDSYFCEIWGLHHDITPADRANADAPLDPDQDASEYLTEQMLISREADWSTNYFATSKWTGSTTASDITPTSLWDTVAGTPIDDVRAQSTSILKNVGVMPNTFVLGIDTFDALCDHPDILDRIKYTQEGSVTEALLARLFRVDNLYVARAIRNTGKEGAASDTMGFINGSNDALLVYSAPSPGIRRVSGGYTFVWNAPEVGGNSQGQAISSFWLDEIKADRIEIEAAFDHKLVAATAGAFFSNVTS